MRISELAKKIGKDLKEVLEILEKNGIKAKHMNSVTLEMVNVLKDPCSISELIYDQLISSNSIKKKRKSTSKSSSKKAAKPKIILLKAKKKAPVLVKEEKEKTEETSSDTETQKKEIKETTSETKNKNKKITKQETKAKEISQEDNEKPELIIPSIPIIEENTVKKVKSKNKPTIRQVIFTNNKKKEKIEADLVRMGEYKADKKFWYKKTHHKHSNMTPEEKKNKGKDLNQLNKEIANISKRKVKKKSKLIRILKKKKIAEKLNREQEEEIRQLKVIRITDPTSVQDLSQKMNVSITDIISFLMKNGEMVTANQKIDADLGDMIATEFGFETEISKLFEDEETEQNNNDIPEVENTEPRAPIVTIMGHVDHGKTTLLDNIRKSNIVAQESGNITQHIGAYQINYKNKKITFLDTPGHKAFSAMRSRGAQVTDIIILIVAADDGLMPQTLEAINHAKAAKVPLIVAINKIDKDGINLERIKQQLAEKDLLLEDWGGEILSTEISALKGKNINKLLEQILLQSEILELKANSEIPAVGTVVEASMVQGAGSKMTVLIQNGTLKKGDFFVAGTYSGKVRALLDDNGKTIKQAGPSTPVNILGCSGVPDSGEPFTVLSSEKEARDLAEKRQILKKETEEKRLKHTSLENLFSNVKDDSFKQLNVIIKADVYGSVEAIISSLTELNNEKIEIKIIHEGVGGINESDITLAAASDSIIIGFKVRPDMKAKQLAKKEGIQIRLYDIIYKLLDEIKASMEGMLDIVIEEDVTGSAEVLEVFKVSKLGNAAGARVIEGKIVFPANARIIRDNIMIYDGKLASLKHFKEEVKEMKNGQECGIGFEKFDDLKVQDIIECYRKVEVKQTL